MTFWQRFLRKEVPPIEEPEVAPWSSPADGIAHSLRTFGLGLLQRECSQRPKENVFISPLSIFLALTMTENGAGGATKAAMRRALALPSYPSEEAINDSVFAHIKSLRSQSGIELAIANALWVDTRSTIAPEFVRVCQEIYKAAVRTLDLNQPSAAIVINEWVAEKTRGKIPRIVTPEVIASSPAVISNAVYFKGKFRNPFRKEATEPRTFYLADRREKLVPMMRQSGLLGSYRSGKRFEAAVLHYKGSNTALYLLLPSKGSGPEETLSEDSLQALLVAEESVELDLSMPRFTIDFSSHLKESLTQMGMGIAFQYPGADFAPLGSPLFFIGEVIHKTLLGVDEEGTVAAAATGIEWLDGATVPEIHKTKTLVFDRPFAVLLKDTVNGAILFAGVIYEP